MTHHLAQDELKPIEDYLLAGDSEDLAKKAINQNVQGSAPYYYLYYLHMFKTVGVDGLSDQEQENLKNFTDSPSLKYTWQAKQIALRHQLLKHDSKKTSKEERRKIVEDLLNFHLKYKLDHCKPDRGENDSESQKEDQIDKSSLTAVAPHLFEISELRIQMLIDSSEKLKKLLLEVEEGFKEHTEAQEANISGDEMRKVKEKNQKRVREYREESSNCRDHLRECYRQDEGFIHEFDFTKILPKIVFDEIIIENVPHQAKDKSKVQNESLLVQLASFVGSKSESELSNFTIRSEVLQHFTLKQLDKIAELTPWFKKDENFIGSYFQKQFAEELLSENQESWSKQDKLDLLNRLYVHAKSKGMPNEFQLEFLMEILNLGPKCGVYSKENFNDFIKLSEKTLSIYDGADERQEKKHIKQLEMTKSKLKQRPQINWNQYISKLAPSSNTSSQETELVRKYLTHFCMQNNGSLDEYQKHFDKMFLRDIQNKAKVMLSKDGMSSLGDEVDLDFFKSIADKVVLEFSENNRETFSIEEEVSLNVTLKNISKLSINIFEFNTETYYKKNLKPFDTSVDLDGLLASEQESHQYDHSSNYQHMQTFKFPSLTNKIGLFIVEFVGNGVNARAVIKKGKLSMVHRSTTAGHLCYILDQNKQICCGEKRTGVYFDSKFYDADKKNGRIFIPYGKQELSSKIIMVNGDFAQLGEFTRKTESYEFEAMFYLNTESILVGSSTNIVIKPKLSINGRKADVKDLKNSKVVVQTTNYIDSVPITRNYDGISFENHSECTIQFQVPPSLGSIRVSMTTQVQNATTKKMEDFSHSESFPILTQQNRSTTTDAFLQRKKDGYRVMFLGKNGEPQVKKSIEVNLSHRYRHSENITMQTDADGMIKLGFLDDINKIKVVSSSLKIGASFKLPDYFSESASEWNHYSKLRLLEGNNFDLPIIMRRDETTLRRKWLSLVRTINNVVVEDCFEAVQLKHHGDEKTGYHSISVDSLDQGKYKLSYVSGNKTKEVTISVSKGSLWESNDNFILKDHCLIERMQTGMNSSISKIQITERQEEGKDGSADSHKIRVEVDKCSKDAHMLLFATTFIPYDPSHLPDMLYDMQSVEFSASVFHFAKWNNLYQSNRELSDEIRYVFDRKKLESQLGNSLDRPSLLMKRNYVRDTEVVEEQLALGTQFKKEKERQMESRSRKKKKKNSYQRMTSFAAENCESNVEQLCASNEEQLCAFEYNPTAAISERHGEITEVQNFLKNPPFQKFNLKPITINEEQSSVIFETTATLTQYEHLQVIIVDKDSVTQRLIDLDSTAIVKRDLRLNKKLDASKGLTETRSNKTLIFEEKKGFENKDFIEDITSSEVTMVDDMVKVNEILDEIMKINGNNRGFQDYKKFYSFIGKWANGQLTREDKDKYYTEYLCHELNLFLKKRDQDYFKAVVRPFLKCKMEKTFVDDYLLGNYEKVAKYADFHLIQNLNVMEQCLLIDSLVQLGQTYKACMIAEKINLEVQSMRSNNMDKRVTYENKIFDLVLNLNNLNDIKDGLEKIKDEAIIEEECKRQASLQSSSGVSYSDCDEANYELQEAVEITEEEDDSDDELNDSCMEEEDDMMGQQMMMNKQLNKCAFDEDIDFNEIRAENIKKEVFEKVEETSEYMETHYYNNKVIGSFSKIITKNTFWAEYADYLANGAAKKGMFERRLTCEHGHPVMSHGKKNKSRADENGKPLPDENRLKCDSCGKKFTVQDGFYSCAETCDFDLCSNCAADPKGNILVKQKGLPETYLANSKVQCDRCNKVILNQRLEFGFLRSPTYEYDVCRTCIPCASHTWKQAPIAGALDERGPFITSSFTECTTAPIEAFFVGCFLDLPYKMVGEHVYQPDEQRGVTIKAGSNLILYKKEIQETDINLKADLLVIHRYNEVDGIKSKDDSGIPEIFFTNIVYECEVIITNVSPRSKQFTLLYQVPQGSMPMRKTKYMKSHFMSLDPFTTKKMTFQFYFPSTGRFRHFPSNVSVDQVVIAKGSQNTLRVEANRRITEIQSFDDLLQAGSKEDILDFLKTENLSSTKKNFQFGSMLYLLQDKEFFTAVITILRERSIFNKHVWTYAFYHKDDEELMRECIILNHTQSQFQEIGERFESNLVSRDVSNVDRGFTSFLEYHPMVNTRAHRVGKEGTHSIMNVTFNSTYNKFLTTFIQKQSHCEFEDKMMFVYYLQLQDRIQEATALFKTLPAPEKDSVLKVQYDYLIAYFDFFTGADSKYLVARRIVQQYDNYPIRKWRMMFLAILDQLNEFDGEFDEENVVEQINTNELAASSNQETEVAQQRQQNKKKAIKREPNISQIDINDDGLIKIETVNIKTITVKYYLINAELLFSRSPFLKSNAESFSYVSPFQLVKQQMVPDDADEGLLNTFATKHIPLPNELKNMNANLVIEINGGDLQKFHTFYQNQLKVTVLETFGELKVCDNAGKPMPKVYVKVYYQSKQSGKDCFFRDGYTDIRGKIDYAQTSGDKLKDVKRFSILVQSDTLGSKIQEADPPKGDSDFGHDQTGPTGMTGLAASKMNRMANRQNQKMSSKSKMNMKY